MRIRQRSSSTGFIMIDILAGLFLLAALTSAMIVAQHMRQLASQKFGDQRQAIEIARETLADLQANHPIPTETQHPGAKISVAPTTQATDPPGWSKVTVVFNGQRATLEGITTKLALSPNPQPAEKTR